MFIPGLLYVAEFISPPEQTRLLTEIDRQEWSDALKRRVQHYGYRYDYKTRKIDRSMYLGALPDWVSDLTVRLVTEGYIRELPDQLIVNEYEPGQGIAAHVDCIPCFGAIVCSITLGSGCTMNFTEVEGKGSMEMYLDRGSLLVLADAARYNWQHGIPARQSDKIDGRSIPRSRRVSLTFRTTIAQPN